ncbi:MULTISPECIES: cupin domain-containing protein [Terribacillus]|uniref:Mannose-6-phosphate isomerase, cupin superfamily n=1 Tax=Terribacillus saccharophilus TaxID=361277 RepID=A0AAX2EDR9_9BACI|nr:MULTISPECIES: cupin domain-containing protein [Terribacillus]QXE03577.1 cupin domain-containing protein [Terribacillus sp. DMT04]SEM86942.1 Mannose-6-phosphate isomerase, cupin superfamily [Terribacillus saccharophilus]
MFNQPYNHLGPYFNGYNHNETQQDYRYFQNQVIPQEGNNHPHYTREQMYFRDHGGQPFVVDINVASKRNNNYRNAIWTGEHLQVTLMSINPGEDIGLEVHPNVDQFLRIEQGQGFVQMGSSRNNLNFQRNAKDDDAIIVPAGTWHNVTNTGSIPLKLYSIYAPPNHPFGTVHHTKAQAMHMER